MSSVISRIMITPVLFSTLLGASQIDTRHLFATSLKHRVTHTNKGFFVDGQKVKHEDLSKDLQKASKTTLKSLLSKNYKLRVGREGNDFTLKTQQGLRGGGPIGAWVGGWVGYAGVMTGQKLITAGIVYGVAIVCPPAAIVVGALADTVLTVVAQPIAITAAVGGAIAGGVLTGPA